MRLFQGKWINMLIFYDDNRFRDIYFFWEMIEINFGL